MARRAYHQGQMLHERFVLDRPLRAEAIAPLWVAQDVQLETPVLLRIYADTAGLSPATIDTLRRIARHARALRHPHVARIHDVHVEDEYTLVSLDAHEGVLLETWLARATPMPYRRVVEVIRPVIHALVHMHDGGGEHGQLDANHILVDEEDRYIVLPGDGTRPPRGDTRQLGRLLATLLTGGNAPDEGADLNDLADRLHQGRTIPALFNQLVNDLARPDLETRPASMRDVLHRLDQLEAVVAPAPGAGDAPEPSRARPIRVAASSSRASRPRALPGKAAWIVASLVLLGAAIALIAVLARPETQLEPAAATPPPGEAIAESAPGDEPPDVSESPTNAADLLAAKHAAEEALGAYLDARGEADTRGARTWNHEAYALGAAAAADADKAFVAEQYEPAAAGYRVATNEYTKVVAAAPQVLTRLLAEGKAALDAPDAARARTSFESALLIEPGNDVARRGLKRTETIDELHRMLAAGHAHENEGRMPFAFAEYAAAAQLDPLSGEATNAVKRVRQRLADEEFQAMMSAGLTAYHGGDLDTARRRLFEARALRPDATEVAEAIAMVDEARLRAEVVRLRQEAEQHEESEQWQAARHVYRQVLAIDPAIEFAQRGVAKSEEMIGLVERTRRYLSDTQLLMRRGTREDAARLVEQLAELPRRGPKLETSYERLVEQMRLVTTPRRVVLKSDEKTHVDVYRVGRYGTLRSVDIELLPGRYTVVGSREGFKDVRLVLDVEPKIGDLTLEVVCREPI